MTLGQWNRAVNLVAKGSLRDGYDRHVLDAVQVAALLPSRSLRLCDLGSGGGLPALPIAILRRGLGVRDHQVLIESDRRKAAFLMHVSGLLDLALDVRSDRVEAVPPVGADVVTARALAPLVALMPHLRRHLSPAGVAVLHKGRNVGYEIEAARRRWSFRHDRLPSVTDADGVILRIAAVQEL